MSIIFLCHFKMNIIYYFFSWKSNKLAIAMSDFSLIEYKLRRYIYLGHEYNIYVPPLIRKNIWKNPAHQENLTGVRIIGKIVKKNKIEEINSIVPILLKVFNISFLFLMCCFIFNVINHLD